MKNKIKAYMLIAMVIFLFTGLTLRTFADSATSFTLTLESSDIVTGGQFSVTVEGMNIAELNAYEVNLSFDTEKLEFVKAKSRIEGYSIPTKIEDNQITIACAMGDRPALSGDLTICTITFKAKTEGKAIITLNSVKILDGILAETAYTPDEKISLNITDTPPIISVSGIEVEGVNGITKITKENGTLQMIATVLPIDATNKNVIWSVENNTGSATISAGGLLKAVSNGAVTVKATAEEEPGVYGICVVEISYRVSQEEEDDDDGNYEYDYDDDKPGKGDDRESAKDGEKEPPEDAVKKVEVTVDSGDGKEANIGFRDKALRIQVESTERAREIKVNVPAREIAAESEGYIDKLEIETGIATAIISTEILRDKNGELASSVVFSVSRVDKSLLNEETRQLVGDNDVYEFDLSVDGKKIRRFDSSDAMIIAINYTLKPGEDPDKVVVYYIDDSGKLKVVKNGRYNPATGKVEFSPEHFSKYTAVYNDVTFNDISDVPWAKVSIEALAARSIINGYEDGTFKPDRNVTRAEFIKILIQAFDLVDESDRCTLTDVEEGAWYYSSVASAQKLGITKGRDDGNFGINDQITRQDMAVMIYRAAQLLKVNLSVGMGDEQFIDEYEISEYAKDAISAMQKSGIIVGVGGGSFAPMSQATRAQTAVIIYRLFNLS